jgi:peptide/nickel transport system substrate-binding protein
VVNQILNAGPALRSTEADWQKLNHRIMDLAVYVPIYWGRTLYYRNPRMTNVTQQRALVRHLRLREHRSQLIRDLAVA